MAVHPAKDPSDEKRQQDEVKADDRVGDEGIVGLVGEIGGVIESVALLAKGGEAGKENQRGCVKEEDRLVPGTVVDPAYSE